MKILVIRNAYQKDAGGAEQYSLNLCIALKIAGHKPTLVTKVAKIHDKALEANIPAVEGPWHNTQKWDRLYYLRYPLFVAWYMYVILRRRIDIVHPQSRDDFVFATRAAKFLGKPVIWTDHADLKYVLDNVNHYNPRMRGWVIKAAEYAAAIVCPSNSEKTSISQVAPELDNLIVVHNGVFLPENVQPVEKTNHIIIGTNARLVPSKGISELIDAFTALKNKQADLWLLGGVSGNRQKYLEQSKKLGISGQVKFWDYVGKPNDVVASMDIFVHASYHEAFSLAIIEAAMLARPIIATNVGGTPEIIDKHCGILIQPKDSTEITTAINKLLNDRGLRDRLGQATQKKAIANFDFQKIVEKQIVPIYRKAIEL